MCALNDRINVFFFLFYFKMCFALWIIDEMSFLKKLLQILLYWPNTFIWLKYILTVTYNLAQVQEK